MHGGGYMAGSRYLDDKLLDRWSAALNCVGVSVEYRFAPEHPYPTPIEDCYTGFKWMLDNAAKLGIDTSRIVIGGISAGGGLAASLALMARDRGAPSLAGQVLISPMIDDRQSNESNSWDVPIWPPLANRIGWSAYFPQGGAPEYASPARVEDLANLARAYVMVGSAEVFLDESIAYARRLIGAGNMAELQVCGGAPHGFETLALGAATTIRAFGALDAWLSTILKTPLKS
jgi:acetyl esterase/lipase